MPKALRPKTLQPPAARSAQRRRRSPCKLCNNLDPRGHTTTAYDAESSSQANASLTLVIDGLKLQSSGELGCRFCFLVSQALDAFLKDWRTSRGRITINLVEGKPVKVSIEGLKCNGVSLEIYAPHGTRAPWITLGSTHDIPSNSGSDECFTFARKCIQDCLTNPKHGACRASAKLASPKRLLDVGRVDKPIRICEPRGRDIRYASLSHCWGTGPLLTTSSENLKSRKICIDWLSLPALFQDAIIITRQLGMRYLWIDAMCIIQDSKEDWECESAKMGSIYEHSYITIAAATSENSGSHCLTERCKVIKLQYLNTKGKASTLNVRKVLDHHPDPSEDAPARPKGPLTNRAWALQEHVLCSRVLHYTSTELIFECRTAYRCECMPSPKRFATTPALIPKMLSSGKKHGAWAAWHRVIAQYTKRRLTIPSDKLPAISGIASKIQDATKSAYFAGLWRDNLAEGLLWASSPLCEPPHQANRLTDWRAPSFSWASVDTEIQYYESDVAEGVEARSNIKILDAQCTLAGLNPLGEITDGFIKLRGPVLEGILITPELHEFAYQLLIKGASTLSVSPDSLLVEDDVNLESGEPLRTVRRANPDETFKHFKCTVLCLNIASYSHLWISGIVLGLSQRIPGAYERLGVFSSGSEFFRGAVEREIKLV
ncbi:HET-domain-containing protein [Glonium stellatum]|uniref:HET-domain-containing protein n=1 Tax=Glonium stellatum TaxID=574774 RepID=A0A8E2FEG3_9PEZI|nr:HET-domain-containing protein [Glonium stellatum]